jgi:hypothetical protein
MFTKVITALTIAMVTLPRTLVSTTKTKIRVLLSYKRAVNMEILIIMKEVKEKTIINNHQTNNKEIAETAMQSKNLIQQMEESQDVMDLQTKRERNPQLKL